MKKFVVQKSKHMGESIIHADLVDYHKDYVFSGWVSDNVLFPAAILDVSEEEAKLLESLGVPMTILGYHYYAVTVKDEKDEIFSRIGGFVASDVVERLSKYTDAQFSYARHYAKASASHTNPDRVTVTGIFEFRLEEITAEEFYGMRDLTKEPW